jgi:RNA polymerase-interacting CarD/CdnL/TRCF family regulator
MILSRKEKEERVLGCLEQNKTYKEIQDLYHISSRDISIIAKKAEEKKDKEEEKKVQTSITSKAYKLYTKGNSPLHVATTLGIGAPEAQKFYRDYLDLKGCHHLVEVLQQFDRKTIRNFSNSYVTKDNKIDEQKIMEAINISRNLPKIKEEYYNILFQLTNLRNQRDKSLAENKLLINKTLNLQDDIIVIHNKIKEHITDLLKQKDRYIRLSIKTILKIIKEDPEKEILFSNNLRSSDQKISEVVDKFRDGIADTIVDSISNPNTNYYYDMNNSF